jgi:hypothetical protein
MTELEILQEMNSNIKKLLGITVVQGFDESKKIRVLQGLGFNSREISELTGVPISTVKDKWVKQKATK